MSAHVRGASCRWSQCAVAPYARVPKRAHRRGSGRRAGRARPSARAVRPALESARSRRPGQPSPCQSLRHASRAAARLPADQQLARLLVFRCRRTLRRWIRPVGSHWVDGDPSAVAELDGSTAHGTVRTAAGFARRRFERKARGALRITKHPRVVPWRTGGAIGVFAYPPEPRGATSTSSSAYAIFRAPVTKTVIRAPRSEASRRGRPVARRFAARACGSIPVFRVRLSLG